MFNRYTFISALALTLTACDINEGSGEELGEAIDAVEEGKSLEQVSDEVGDIFQRRTAAEKRLDKVGDWIDERREELKVGTNDLGDDAGDKLDKLSNRLEKARADVTDSTKEFGDDVERAIDDIEEEMKDLFTKEPQ